MVFSSSGVPAGARRKVAFDKQTMTRGAGTEAGATSVRGPTRENRQSPSEGEEEDCGVVQSCLRLEMRPADGILLILGHRAGDHVGVLVGPVDRLVLAPQLHLVAVVWRGRIEDLSAR